MVVPMKVAAIMAPRYLHDGVLSTVFGPCGSWSSSLHTGLGFRIGKTDPSEHESVDFTVQPVVRYATSSRQPNDGDYP